MARIIRFAYPTAGLSTLYASAYTKDALSVVNASTGALILISAANHPTGAIVLSDSSLAGLYQAQLHDDAPISNYDVRVQLKGGSTPAPEDQEIGEGEITADASDVAAAIAAVQAVTDKVDEMLENVSGYRFTEAALAEAPAGGTGLDAAGVRAAVGMSNADLDEQLGRHDGKLDIIEASTSKLSFDDNNLLAVNLVRMYNLELTSQAAGNFNIFFNNDGNTDLALRVSHVGFINEKTANLPVDPASSTEIAAGFSSISSSIVTLNSAIGAIPTTAELQVALDALQTHGDDVWAGGDISALLFATVGFVNVASTVGGVTVPLVVFQNSKPTIKFGIVDGTNNPVDVEDDEFRFIVHDEDGARVFSIEDEAITKEASSPSLPNLKDVAVVTINSDNLSIKGTWEYKMWDVTREAVVAEGQFQVKLAPITP